MGKRRNSGNIKGKRNGAKRNEEETSDGTSGQDRLSEAGQNVIDAINLDYITFQLFINSPPKMFFLDISRSFNNLNFFFNKL